MSFSNLHLKPSYNSEYDDLVNDFYIPVLKEAISYKRITGFFSSSSFKIAAPGLLEFIKNKGKMQFILNVILSPADYDAINKGIKSPEEIINDFLIDDIEKIETELSTNHSKVLGWLLANDYLEIKIGYIENKESGSEILHQKVGILEDFNGNLISFSGSNNESAYGWEYNSEKFKAFYSWEEGNQVYIDTDNSDFDILWSNKSQKTRVINFPKAVKEHLIQIKANSIEEFTESFDAAVIDNKVHIDENNDIIKLELRDYQKLAKEEWFNNKYKGLLAMATGTGKTETAIGIMDEIIKSNKPVFVVIAVNGKSLVNQWIFRLNKFNFKCFGASSNPEHRQWQNTMIQRLKNVKRGIFDYSIVITTYQTFSSQKFTDIIDRYDTNLFLICDEVHNVGAPTFQLGLKKNYDYRLGLSATPIRHFDIEGSNLIDDYFGGVVYSFTMEEAMEKINSITNKPFLCKYNYYPSIVPLLEEENDEYIKLSKEISKIYHGIKQDPWDNDKLKRLLIKRSDIKKNAANKEYAFEKILLDYGSELNFCIIFCTGQQMIYVKQLLQKHRIIYSEFTQHQNDNERQIIIKEFEKGRELGGYNVIIAIDCLNEGIDIPSAKIGIFLENSLNPIEFIQRRGRLLRQHENKKNAEIYDFIVEPDFSESDVDDFYEREKNEIQKEFDRFIEFAKLSDNSIDALNRVKELTDKYYLIYSGGCDY